MPVGPHEDGPSDERSPESTRFGDPERTWYGDPDGDRVDDPESKWSSAPDEIDPDAIGPSVRPPTGTDGEGERPIVRLFWRLVVVFNLAIFALALGPMLIIFEGNYADGVPIFVVGVGTFAYGVFRYARFDRRSVEGDESGRSSTDPGETDPGETDATPRSRSRQ